MGWDGSFCTKPKTAKEQAELLCQLFYDDGYRLPTKILKHRLINGVWYAKVETTKEDGSAIVWFAICLVRWEKGQVMRKMMDNTMGPYADDCPTDWFKDVPVDGQFDRDWRNRCYAKQAKLKEVAHIIKSLKAGDRVSFNTTYDGSDEWIYTGKPWLFRKTPSAIASKLRNWRKHIIGVIKTQNINTMTTNTITGKEVHHA